MVVAPPCKKKKKERSSVCYRPVNNTGFLRHNVLLLGVGPPNSYDSIFEFFEDFRTGTCNGSELVCGSKVPFGFQEKCFCYNPSCVSAVKR